MKEFDWGNLMSNYHFPLSVCRPLLFVVQFAARGIFCGRCGIWALFLNLKEETELSGTYFLATLSSVRRDSSHLSKVTV